MGVNQRRSNIEIIAVGQHIWWSNLTPASASSQQKGAGKILEKVNNSKHEEVINLRKAGLTYAEIGRKVSLSRERVRQIITGQHTVKKKAVSNAPDFLMTTAQAAKFLNIHVNTIRRWSNKGILQTYRIGPRGDRRLRRQDIDNLLLQKPANDII